jgi:hypothetical protein
MVKRSDQSVTTIFDINGLIVFGFAEKSPWNTK